MRIKDLSIENVRLFDGDRQKLVFDPNKNITAILGNNGSGKSTLLDTISVMLSSFVSVFPGMGEKQFADTDIHIDGNKRADYLLVGMNLEDGNGDGISMMRSRKGNAKSPQPELKEIKTYAEQLKNDIEAGNSDVKLPIIAYYGTGRGNIKAPEKKRSFQRTYSRWDCYLDTLDPATNFKRFFAWYDTMEDEERREKERRQSFEYRSPVLQAVRRAINIFASSAEQGKRFKDPRIETKPLRFVLDECSENGQVVRELRLEQFSDGYKIIIAMVADIASRMAEANPDMENPLDSPGIVLIDEIDLHLHPRWQQSILRQLKETFRNVQFVVSTHSPIVLLGALDIVQIVRLDGQHIESCIQRDYSSYDVNQLLLSQLFGLDNVLTPETAQMMKRREELLLKQELTEEEGQELKDLERQADRIPIGETKMSQQIYSLINKVADQMGIEL